jgi:hypothetical protein
MADVATALVESSLAETLLVIIAAAAAVIVLGALLIEKFGPGWSANARVGKP